MATKLLFVDHASALGGAEFSLLLILKHLDRKRWQPYVAGVEGKLQDAVVKLGVPFHCVSLERLREPMRSPAALLKTARAIAKISDEEGIDFLYANTVRAAFYTALSARFARRPLIWHMRDFWLSETRPQRQWFDQTGKRLLINAASRVITNSHAVTAGLPPTSKVTVIHNGIEVTKFDPEIDGSLFRTEHGISSDAVLVGMVGRLRPWKGQDCFLRMANRVAKNVPDACFVVAGGDPFGVDDEYPQYLHLQAKNLGLTGRVIFTGQLADIRPLLAALDIFVHPGAPEPFGLVIVEAMAMKKPVVAFAHGAIPEIVRDGNTGVLVAPDDEASLAQAVAGLAVDPIRRQELGAAGRARAVTQFDAARVSIELEAVLDDLLREIGK